MGQIVLAAQCGLLYKHSKNNNYKMSTDCAAIEFKTSAEVSSGRSGGIGDTQMMGRALD